MPSLASCSKLLLVAGRLPDLRFAAERPIDRWLVGALWLEGTLLLVVGLLPDLRFAAERPIDRWLVGALLLVVGRP